MFERKVSYTPEVLQSERREHLLCRTLLMLISNYRNKITVWGVSKLVCIKQADVVSFMNEKKYTLIRVYFEVGTVNEGAFYV
jgi:hypothetical protein